MSAYKCIVVFHCMLPVCLCVQMSIVFSEDGLKDASVPCIAQTFVNHNAQLFKIYVLGKEQFVVKRPSIKNIHAGSKCQEVLWSCLFVGWLVGWIFTL